MVLNQGAGCVRSGGSGFTGGRTLMMGVQCSGSGWCRQAQDANRRGRSVSGRAQLRSAAALWCRARLRVVQSGLGRAWRWLVQAVGSGYGCGKGDSGLRYGRERMK